MKKLVIGVVVGIALVACVVYAGNLDYQCFSDCLERYSYSYCLRVCGY